MTYTNTNILEKHGINLDSIEHLDLEVPIVSGTQRQGDVFLLKITSNKTKNANLIDAKGIVVVRAETNSANTHTLHVLEGTATWLPNARADRQGELVQGWLTVNPDSAATLIHTEEHNVLGIGPGVYEISRQREYAGEWRRVAD